jgi:hypothetical protein
LAAEDCFDFSQVAKNTIIIFALADWDRDEPVPGLRFDEIDERTLVSNPVFNRCFWENGWMD